MIIVTGGAGFIGANFVLEWLQTQHASSTEPVLVVDKLTYAGNMASLASVANDARFSFAQADICDAAAMHALFKQHQPRAVVHFAAESHVDRSILGPGEFIQTNIVGTFTLLEAARAHFSQLDAAAKAQFRFLHVSTDEVYGSLTESDPAFAETNAYAPNSPYSASKAASDHLVRAYFHTYGLPVLTTNCSNNYGPLQFPEKLIPLMILNALDGKPLPVYGDGKNIRDWLYVRDHARAIMRVLQAGRTGEVYNIGGNAEMRNIDVVNTLCARLDALRPKAHGSYADQITYVKDRPGHDQRYAINAHKISTELGWQPQENFASGMTKTIEWYLTQTDWISAVRDGSYKNWVEQNYAKR